jgi:sugar phosphate isomerase/epimerase
MAQDIPRTLAKVRALGVTDVEAPGLFGKPASELRAELDRAGLVCNSLIASYEELAAGADTVAANAKKLGARCVVCSRIPHQRTPVVACRAITADARSMKITWPSVRGRQIGLQFLRLPARWAQSEGASASHVST